SRDRQVLEVVPVQADGGGARAHADDIRNGRLAVAASDEEPDQKAGDDEQKEQEEPEPPPTVRRGPDRLDYFVLGGRRPWGEPADGVVDPACATATPAAAVDPVQPGVLPLDGKRRKSVSRGRKSVEGRGKVGRQFTA